MLNRQKILKTGLNGLTEKYLNDNFETLFNKLGGGKINSTDLTLDTANAINTQWIPYQVEEVVENDSMECNFYIPENIKEISDVKLSVATSGIEGASTFSVGPDIEIEVNTYNIDKPLTRNVSSINDLSIKEPCKTGWNNIKISGVKNNKVSLYAIAEVIIK